MTSLRYGYRIMRKGSVLSALGLGAPREQAFFEDQATWEALVRGSPSVLDYLVQSGFGPGPMGGTMPPGYALAPRDSYKRLQRRLREGLKHHHLQENPEDPFRLDMFMSKVPDCMPPKGEIATIAAGREMGPKRGLWAAALAVVMVVFCGAGYLVADAVVGVPGEPLDQIARAAFDSGLLEALGQDAMIQQLRAEGVIAEEGVEIDEEALNAMRQSLEALRNR